jgi:hypothetical protein
LTANSNKEGSYSVTLPAGTYFIAVDGKSPGMWYGMENLSGPKQVTVRAGQVIDANFQITFALA